MDYLRKKISGNKRRHSELGFNLDLSYITPRVIAMAIPGEGISKLYRNNIEDIKDFLNIKHFDKYFIINLSGEKYDYEFFNDKVYEFDWIDHQAPTLHTLFLICKKMHDYLSINSENVVVINCKAGKGRTGTVICCFLLFCGLFNKVEDALEYYAYKRFNNGEGVTQPSQKRYVYFFNEILSRKIFYPSRVILEGIYGRSFPKSKEDSKLSPYYEICLDNSDKVSYTNKKGYSDQKRIFINSSSDDVQLTDDNFEIPLVGDFTVNIFNNKRISDVLIGRIAFNTAFFDTKKKFLEFSLNQIDPDNLMKNKNYSPDFTLIVRL